MTLPLILGFMASLLAPLGFALIALWGAAVVAERWEKETRK